MTPEILKRLASKTTTPNGEAGGGFASLQPCDVAYGLSGTPEGPAALLRAMYAGDTGQHNMANLYAWATKVARQVTDHRLAAHMARRAADELVYPWLLMCTKCGGSGHVHPSRHNKDGACSACNSTGRAPPTDDEMAATFSLTASEWADLRTTYARIFVRLLEGHADAARNLTERLTDD